MGRSVSNAATLFLVVVTDKSKCLDSDSCGTFRDKWHYNELRGRYEGNPVLSVDVIDTVASIRHKINAGGSQRTHSGAMTKEYMDRMLTWAASKYPLDAAFNHLCFLMTGLGSPPDGGALDKETTRKVEHLAFCAVAFTIWTRYAHSSFPVSVSQCCSNSPLGTSSW